MGENKGQTIFISVIGVATLLVAIIGATFAYFTTQMGGNVANVSATTAKIGAVTYEAQGITTENTAILPGWTSGDKTVTVTLGESDYDVDYTCSLNVSGLGTLTDMTLYVSGDNATAASNGKKLASTDTTVQLATGTLAKGTGDSATLTYSLKFPETGASQNDQQGQTITATVSCATAGETVYYNSINTTGTTTTPSAY